MHAVIAVAAFRVRYDDGPSLDWLAERMEWPKRTAARELQLLRLAGLFSHSGGTESLTATADGIGAALAAWRLTTTSDDASTVVLSRPARRWTA
jgi:hypothetical protein